MLIDAKTQRIIAAQVSGLKYLDRRERALPAGNRHTVRGILLNELDDEFAAMVREPCADSLFLTGEGLAIDRYSLVRFIESERLRLGIDSQGTLPEVPEPTTIASDATAAPVRPDSTSPKNGSDNLTSVSRARKKKGGHLLIDPAHVKAAIDDLKLSGNDDPKKSPRALLLNSLLKVPRRILLRARPGHLKVLDSLRIDYPNFIEVLNWLETHLRLCIELGSSLVWPPFLMHGGPGVGKTAFAKALATRLASEYLPVSIAATSASWSLRGGHKGWRDSGMGMIASRAIRMGDRQALLVLLDEVDKLHDHGKNFPIEPTLLELLEPGQSNAFVDEFLELPINIAPLVTWIGTANVISRVSAPLRSRLQCFAVPSPTKAQMPAIVRSVDNEYRERMPGIARRFLTLNDSVINAFEAVPPRDLMAALIQTYGFSLRRPAGTGKREVLVEDVRRGLQAIKRQEPVAESTQDVMAVAFLSVPRDESGGGGAPPGAIFH